MGRKRRKREGGVVQCEVSVLVRVRVGGGGGCYGVFGVCTRQSVSACSRDWVGLCPQPPSQLLDELHLHSEARLCSAAVTRHLESSHAVLREPVADAQANTLSSGFG